MRSVAVAVALAAAALLTVGPPPVQADDTAKAEERAAEYETEGYQAQLQTAYARNASSALRALMADPERRFATDVCWSGQTACAGDVRLYDFQEKGRGLSEPVLWTARNGATISGHVWMTRHGPTKRPGVVIANGSAQANEELYWWAAQTLARAGYVVLTFDPQTQGKSDTVGEGRDALEASTGTATFFDTTQDALDFLLSRPDAPFCARPSRSATSHCAKQVRRVAEGHNAAHNPFWRHVDETRLGLAGHSYGASGVSWIGQADRRVDAVVAWDSFCNPSPDSTSACLAGAEGDPPGPRVPTLGLSAEYENGYPTPPLSPSATASSRAFSKAGVDSGAITLRGSTHFEWSYLPLRAFRATLRTIDLSTWYTTAWLDRYVKGDPSAERRLLSDRWRSDPIDASIDPEGKGNLYSRTVPSRMDIARTDGGRFLCEDLRSGCGEMTAERDDTGPPGAFSFLDVATARDGQLPGGVTVEPTSAERRCASRRRIALNVRRAGLQVRRAVAYVGGREVARSRTGQLNVDLSGRPRGTVSVRIRVDAQRRRSGENIRFTVARTYRLCQKRAR